MSCGGELGVTVGEIAKATFSPDPSRGSFLVAKNKKGVEESTPFLRAMSWKLLGNEFTNNVGNKSLDFLGL